MVSRRLTTIWFLLALALVAAGGVMIAFSLVWRAPNDLRHFAIPDSFLLAGLALGIAYVATFPVGFVGIIQHNAVTMGLHLLQWVLLIDGAGTVAVGSLIWYFTLKERANYFVRFNAEPANVRQAFQDEFSCCGYYFPNDTQAVYAGFCQNQTFALQQSGCVTALTGVADFALNNIFTTVYGFMTIIVFLFLATLCVINKRVEAERFRKIDLKRGGKGFV